MAVAHGSYSETLELVFTHSACWRTAAHDADVDMHARTASDKVTICVECSKDYVHMYYIMLVALIGVPL